MYNITFNLGDSDTTSYREYHMESNYSASEIEEAYEKACKMMGYYFTESCFSNSNQLNDEDKQKLYSFGIITTEDLTYEEWCLDDYIDIFIGVVRLILPDFELEYRNLNEQFLYCIDGSAEGLFGIK